MRIFAELIRSIVTGDSRILEGVLVAETTTSWPSVLAGVSDTASVADVLVTCTSLSS